MSNIIKKSITKQIGLNILIIALVLLIFTGTSFSFDGDNKDNKDLLIETGNMQVILKVPNTQYNFLDNLKYGVSDEIGVMQDGYNFTITNTGNIPIEYYEIKLVDEENKISTLPHNYLRFTIRKNNEDYQDIKNLGDSDNILYSGDNLLVGDTVNFNFKLWLDEAKSNFYNLELYSALEVILYQKKDIYEKYVLYSSFGSILSKTSIYSPVSTIIPKKDGYTFLGWSTSINGDIKYKSGDTYQEPVGKTLYAVWEKTS